MLSIAVLGAGRIGQIHARNVATHPSATLFGVADIDAGTASRLAHACGSRAIALDDAFAADAVLIGTPTSTHAELIERAARAGKQVFCEKPVDLSADRVRACLAVVAATGAKLMVGFNRRFDPTLGALRARLAAGEVGKLELLTILSRDPAPPPVSYIAHSGGLFRDMMIHDFDMARFLLSATGAGEPVEVFAAGSVLVDPAIGAAGDVDTAAVTLRTAAGVLVQISNSRRATYGYDQRIEAHGSAGLLRAGNHTATAVEVANASGFTGEPALPFFLERYAAAYKAELAHFVAALQGGTAPRPDGTDGLKALVLADAATESARSGKAIPVELGA